MLENPLLACWGLQALNSMFSLADKSLKPDADGDDLIGGGAELLEAKQKQRLVGGSMRSCPVFLGLAMHTLYILSPWGFGALQPT